MKDFHRLTAIDWLDSALKQPGCKKSEFFRLQLLWPQSLPQQVLLPSPP